MSRYLIASAAALLLAAPSFAQQPDPRVPRIIDVLDKMDQRMNRIEDRLANVEGKLSALESRYSTPAYTPSYTRQPAYRPAGTYGAGYGGDYVEEFRREQRQYDAATQQVLDRLDRAIAVYERGN
jgi:uncharacterized protein YukE